MNPDGSKYKSQPILTVELVPSTCWYTNVRSHVPQAEWDALRRAVYRRAKNRCEICGGRGKTHPVECHEVWHYDDMARVQRLTGFAALCPDCHQVKHIGLANVQGKSAQAISHLAKVNGWSAHETRAYVTEAFELWARRSEHEWRLDLSLLETEAYKAWLERQVKR